MAIYKFQSSRLIFDFIAKVAHIGVPAIYLSIVFSETIRPIELNFLIMTHGETL